MPEKQAEGTEDSKDLPATLVSRRRWMQAAGLGIATAVTATTAVSAGSDELPNTIIVDGSAGSGESTYELLVSGSAAQHPDIGGNEPNGGHVEGTVRDGRDAYIFSGTLSYLDVSGNGEITIQYGDHTEDEPGDTFEIVAATDGEVSYEFTSEEPITKVLDNGDRSADEGEDEVQQNDDGSYTALGSTANGYGDTYSLRGDIERFEPIDGEFRLFLEGEEVTVPDLTGQEPPQEERTHSYSFVGTGDTTTDYYLEVEEGGNMIASTINGAVIEDDLHWVSDDGTRAAGRVSPDERHAYEFDTLVLDVTIDGSADALVNGNPSNLDLYPRDGAAGDDWKGGFPWQEEDEEQEDEEQEEELEEHVLEIRSTDRTPAMYYEFTAREIGDYAYLRDHDDIIEGDDEYRADGQVGPSGRDAYTVLGTLSSWDVVDGQDRYVDESRFGLYWDGEETTLNEIVEGGYEPPEQEEQDSTGGAVALGGGDGYDRIVTQSDADFVVSNRSELRSALSNASSGDVVFVESGAQISMNGTSLNIGRGVTLASDRGHRGSGGALLQTSRGSEPSQFFRMYANSRITGLRMVGPWSGGPNGNTGSNAMTVVSSGVEIDNCEIGQFSYAGVNLNNGEAHVHHNHIYDINRGGLGYGVTMGTGQPVIEYNYFNYNRHSIASNGSHTGYICRYNHFGPDATGGVIDIHTPGGVRSSVHNNVIEAVEQIAGTRSPLQSVQIRGVPSDYYELHDNWFFNPLEPRSSPAGSWTNEAIIQATETSWRNVDFWDNYYGSDANTTFDDIIPGYDGYWS